MSFGNCGYAFPTAIGAKAAAPERPAVAYVGDGAWGMSFGEILTCVREELPVTAVVFNNRQWGGGEEKSGGFFMAIVFSASISTSRRRPIFPGIARSMGAQALRIENAGGCRRGVGEGLRRAKAGQDDDSGR